MVSNGEDDGPTARYQHACALVSSDADHATVLVAGGTVQAGNAESDEIWKLHLSWSTSWPGEDIFSSEFTATWTKLSLPGCFTKRAEASLVALQQGGGMHT